MNDIQSIQVTKLIETLGLDTEPDAERIAFLTRVGKLLFDSVLLRVVAEMDEEQVIEMQKRLDKNLPQEELLAYIQEIRPDLETVFEEEALELRNQFFSLFNIKKD